MILGIDAGGSAVKLACLDNGRVCFSRYIANRSGNVAEQAARALREAGIRPAAAAMTGVGAAVFETERLGLDCPVRRVLEIEAMAAGTRQLTGLEEFLTVSVGTGTAFVLRKNGQLRHIGGSAFGGGTLTGLCEKILGDKNTYQTLSRLCPQGDLARVDLLMSELPSCPPTLDPKMTAANLAKTGPDTTDADWAIGILNLVMQTIGSMAYLAAGGHGVDNIVFTGGPTGIAQAKDIIAPFNQAYGIHFLIPDYSECATAVGAACLCTDDKM